VPDQLGNVTLVAVGEKSQSDEYKWTTAATNGSKISVTPTNLSQMAWVDGTLFGATMAGGTSCSGGGYQGALEIRSRTSGSVIDAKTIPLVGTNSWAKPEGIAIVPVNGSHSGSCAGGTTHIVYVTDYCQSQLFTYSWDGTNLTFETAISLDAASLSSYGTCNPSHVEYHTAVGDVIAVCQSRGALVFTHTQSGGFDQCNPGWAASDDVELQYTTNATSCSTTPTAYTYCHHTDGSPGDCSLHDLAYDDALASGWVFTNASSKGEVIAVRASAPHDQTAFFVDTTSFSPYELELGSN
jgi:hypothetical protein